MTIMAIILGIVVVIQPYFLLKAVKFGIKCAERPEEAVLEPFFDVKTDEEREITDEERKAEILRQNIDNYVGDSTNQQEVI